MIRVLIFDFDGLILETEEPIFLAWQEIYNEFGCQLSMESWSSTIGTSDFELEPLAELERQYGAPIDRDVVLARHHAREAQFIQEKTVLPGVCQYLEDARHLGLKLAVASSSDRAWVAGHLNNHGLLAYFDTIKTSDDVQRTKPDPDLFMAVLKELNLMPDQALVLEDSPHGVKAAQRAGIFAVVVPNVMTRDLEFEQPHLRLNSLEEMDLETLLANLNGRSTSDCGFPK